MGKNYEESCNKRHDRVGKRERQVLQKRYQALLRQGYEPEEAIKRVAREKHRDIRTVWGYVRQLEKASVAPSIEAEDVTFEFEIWKKNQELQDAIEGLLNNLNSAENAFCSSGFDMEGWDKKKERLDRYLRNFLLPRTGNAKSEGEVTGIHTVFNIVDAELAALFNEYYLRWPESNSLKEGQAVPSKKEATYFIESVQAWITPSCKVPLNLRPGPCREDKRLCPLLDTEKCEADVGDFILSPIAPLFP